MKKEINLDGDIVYLKKDWFGWRTYEKPTKWWHFIIGGKRNAFTLVFFILLALCFYLGITEMLASYKTVILSQCAPLSKFNYTINMSIP